MEDVTKWVDEGSPVDIIYIDFQKAFGNLRSGKCCLILGSVSASGHENEDPQYTMGDTVLNTTVKKDS